MWATSIAKDLSKLGMIGLDNQFRIVLINSILKSRSYNRKKSDEIFIRFFPINLTPLLPFYEPPLEKSNLKSYI